MSGRALAACLVLSMLAAGVIITPGASAELEAPTMSARPVINGEIEEAEWGVASSNSFSSPRVSTSSVRIGYLDSAGELVLGFVLSDETSRTDDQLDVYVAPRSVESDDTTETKDRKYSVFANGNWEVRKGNGNETTGFPSGDDDDGTSPGQTGSEWSFAYRRTASSWVVEMAIDIGTFEAGDTIRVGYAQTDAYGSGADEQKTVTKPGNLDKAKPGGWELTTLTGRPSNVQLRVSPSDMEAAVGGDILVNLPADANGGNLTVSVQAPGAGGFTPLETLNPGSPGTNSFFFAPEKVGTYKIKADWEGDEDYARTEVGPLSVGVARPTQAGPTVLETGSMRIAFAQESAHAPAEWRYLNTRVWATDGEGEMLDLVELDSGNSCRKEPSVGFANMDEDDSSLVLHFDPPVRRSALALISPQDSFTANWKGYDANDALKFQGTGTGTCGSPVFESIGNIEDTVERIEIEYAGDDKREVVDVAFAHALTSTEPKISARAVPSPIHAGGVAEVTVSAGSPHRLSKATVTLLNNGASIATERCDTATPRVWIDCTVSLPIPDTDEVDVEVKTVDRFGTTVTQSTTLETETDRSPPRPSLLPRPMLAPPGGAVAVTATGTDASGVASISITARTAEGERVATQNCRATAKERVFDCKLAVSPDEGTFTFVEATFTDRAGNNVTVGPKPLPVRGQDTDGDGLPDDLEDEIGTSRTNVDTDGDGLSDGWEVVGVDRSGDGEAELDLAALGADPQVKDIFLEFDWAEHEGHSHQPRYGAIQLVRNLFAAHGIRVHTDIQQEGGPFDPARFDHGHAAHRHLMDDDRAGIFMHVLAGHVGGPSSGGGGTIYLSTEHNSDQVSGRVGAQLLHEIGHQLGLGHGGGGTTGDGDGSQQAAFAEDYKPNYLSVMNDAYAWGLIIDTTTGLVRVPSYAGLAIGDLDEKSLDEAVGVSFDVPELEKMFKSGSTEVLEPNTVTGLRVRYTCPDEGPTRWGLAPGPMDWNCDGSTGDTGITADINRGGDNSGQSKLYSRTDWDALSFVGTPCPQYALMLTDDEDQPANDDDHGGTYGPLGLAPCPLRPSPTTPLDSQVKASATEPDAPQGNLEEADGRDNDGDGKVDDGFADTDGDGVVNIIDDCPTVADPAQLDHDADGRGDACQATPATVTGASAGLDQATAMVEVSWEPVQDAWGYNVYKIADGNVTRLGEGFPSTSSAKITDPEGETGDRYVIRAINEMADQGPPMMVTSSGTSTGGGGADGNGTDGNGTDTPQEGVPGPGAIVALGAVLGGAMVARWRQRRDR